MPRAALKPVAAKTLKRSTTPKYSAWTIFISSDGASAALRSLTACAIQSYPGYASGENTTAAVYDSRTRTLYCGELDT